MRKEKRMRFSALLSVLLMITIFCSFEVNVAKAYHSSTHEFVFNQANQILKNDGWTSISDFLSSLDPADPNGRTYLEVMIAGSSENDNILPPAIVGDSSCWEHYMDPTDHHGIGYLGVNMKSAGQLCQERFIAALNDWVVDGNRHKAMYDLGWAAHLVQDLCVPQHAYPTWQDGHTAYEDWVDTNKASFAVTSGGIYTFSSFPDSQYYLPAHYEGPYVNHGFDWVDYNAHESIKYWGSVNFASGWQTDDYFVETVHSLPNSISTTWVVTEYQASQIQIHFSSIQMETNYDYVKIYDANDNLIASYTGTQSDVWTPIVFGNTLKIKTTTDVSVQSWGYKTDTVKFYDTGEDLTGATAALLSRAQRTVAGFIKCFFDWVDAHFVSISPASVVIDYDQSQLFTSTVTGSSTPDSYQWYLCGNVSGNIVTNPGFETGDSTGWNEEGPNNVKIRSDEHHTGSYCCASLYIGSPSNLYLPFRLTQKFAVPSNIVTSVGCWYKYGVSGIDWLRVNYTDGSVTSVGLGGGVSSWTYVTLSLAANKTIDSLIIERTASNGYIVCVDDVQLICLNGAPVSGATGTSWTFTPSSPGSYTVYLRVTYAYRPDETSNIVPVTVTELPYNCYNADSMWVDPTLTVFNSSVLVGQTFNVTVWMNITENVYAYQIALHYNRTLLACTRVGFTAGLTSSYFTGHTSTPSGPIIDATTLGNGSILGGESLVGATAFIPGPKCASLIWAEFQILLAPAPGQTLNSKFDITTETPSNNYVLDTDLNTLTVSPYDGNYQFTSVPFVSISPSSPVVMDVGQSQLFTSSISGGTPQYSYQWYLNYAPVSGATINSWTFTPTSSGSYTVYLNVTDSVGVIAISNTTTATVNGHLNVSISPSSSFVMDVDQSQTFNSTVTGGTSPFSYQWYLYIPTFGGHISFPVSGATGSTWTFAPSSSGSCGVYVQVTDNASFIVNSTITNVTVNTPPSVTISPTSVIMDVGQSQTFNSTVSNGTLPYSYEWCLNGTAVPSANSSSWTFTPILAGAYTIYVNVTDSVGVQASSGIVPVTVLQPIHDVAVTNVACSKTVVCQNFTANITVTASNPGNFTETFNVTAYANGTAIQTETLTLANQTSTTLTFTWDTTGFGYGNYTLSAYAWPVLGESNKANNNFSDGWVFISMVGDLTGPSPGVPDGKCDIRDIALVAKAFGSAPGLPGWNANCDITGSTPGVPDDKVDIRDMALVAKHFGEASP